MKKRDLTATPHNSVQQKKVSPRYLNQMLSGENTLSGQSISVEGPLAKDEKIISAKILHVLLGM